MKTSNRHNIIQGIVDDAVARVDRGEFSADNMEEAIEVVQIVTEIFEENLNDNEIVLAAHAIIQEFE